MNQKRCNVFTGENAILDYLNPESQIFTPLVELPKVLNPFYDDGVRIYAKLLNTLPLTNVKSIPAFNMLKEMNRKGELNDVHTIIENSSGNTVLSLAVIGRLLGIPNTKAFVSYEVLFGKLQMLQLFGVEPLVNKEPICPDPADKTSGIYKAKKWGKRKDWINPGQYENTDNPDGHKKITGPQIFEQLNGDVQMFCAGLGTTGTMVGTADYLKGKSQKIKTLGVIRTPNNPVPGVRTRGLLKMIAFNWKNYVDFVEEVGTKDSFLESLHMIRHGIVVGPSSGFALAGLLNFLKKQKEKDLLKSFANKEGFINAVFICCDSPFPYLKDYFLYLDKSNFPEISNYEILIDKPDQNIKLPGSVNIEGYEIEPQQAFSLFYKNSKEEVEKKLNKGETEFVEKSSIIIDVRSKDEFDHFHLPDSIHVDYENFISRIKTVISSNKLVKRKVLVVCSLGLKSNTVTNILRKEKVQSFSLKGGITEWSNLDLPRWKPGTCLKNRC
ncbi:pyridoxal-phosphate dependent enzyme [Patescibacteria group bacterium]|nr:pyridoxal-phosphate dependent enzyme [Patescibacteria group bacterium]